MDATDIDALRREQLELRKRLDAIDGAIAQQRKPEPDEIERRFSVTISVPSNGFQRPTDDEMLALAERAYETYDFLDPCIRRGVRDRFHRRRTHESSRRAEQNNFVFHTRRKRHRTSRGIWASGAIFRAMQC